MGCCLAPSALVTALTAAGLGGLLRVDMGVTVPVLYAMVGLALGGIAWACRRARQWFPLALGLPGGAVLLIPFHEALEVWPFHLLAVGGQVSLMAAAGLAAWRGRRCRQPAPIGGAPS